VTGCDRDGVSFAGGRIDSATVIWAAGVAASAVAGWIEAEHDRAGRIKVNGDLSIRGRPNDFVAGDLASVQEKAGHLLPGIAPAAKQMGRYVGKKSSPRASPHAADPPPFVYRHYGDLATIGRKAAVVKLGRFELKRIYRLAVLGRRTHLFSDRDQNRFVIAVTWLWSYLTFRRGARLISEQAGRGRRYCNTRS
jgi:NADH dehydrogenase